MLGIQRVLCIARRTDVREFLWLKATKRAVSLWVLEVANSWKDDTWPTVRRKRLAAECYSWGLVPTNCSVAILDTSPRCERGVRLRFGRKCCWTCVGCGPGTWVATTGSFLVSAVSHGIPSSTRRSSSLWESCLFQLC